VIATALVVLVIAVDRLVSAVLVDGVASYASTRFVVAAACGLAGGALLVAGVVQRHRPRREP
jgi:hypothetical protein